MDEIKTVRNPDQNVSILGANTIFFIGAAILFGLGILIQIKDVRLEMTSFSTIAIQVVFFLVPSCAYIVARRKNVKEVLRLNKISIGNGLIVFGMTLFAIPLIGFINLLIHLLISTFGRPLPNPLPEINNVTELFLGLIVLALCPAICEEVMARGVIMRGYERFGKKTALIVSALLFSIMHRNIQTIIPIFLIGLLLGYVVYRTNSIFAGVIAHFTNNSIAVLATYGVRKLQQMLSIPLPEAESIQMPQLDWMSTAFFMLLVIFAAAAFWGLMTLLRHNTERTVVGPIDVSREDGRVPFAYYIPLILGCIFILIELILQICYILELPVPFLR